MNHFKNKVNKIIKIIFPSSLAIAAISCLTTSSLISNTNNNSIVQSNTNLNADSTTVDPEAYNHTNYFQMPATMPTGFDGYNLFATTNNSQLVQTSMGILGISTDKTTFYFTSYSGKIIWAQQFSTNSLVKKFYASNGWDLTTSLPNLQIKEWVLMDSTKGILAILLSDGTNSFVTNIYLSTGLFYPSYAVTSYTLDPANIFVSLGSNLYTTISKFSNYIFLSQGYDMTKGMKLLTLSDSKLTLSTDIDTTAFNTALANKKVVSFFSTDRYVFEFSIDKTSYKNQDGKYYYHQYVQAISFPGLAISSNVTLPNDFITDSSTLDTSGFKNINFWFTDSTTSGTKIIFLDGNDGYNHLNSYVYTSATSVSTYSNLSLEGNTISSVALSQDNSKLYLSNSKSNTGVNLSYVDLTQPTLSISSIRQTTDTTAVKDYYLIPVLSYSDKEYLMLQDNSKTSITYLLNSGGNYVTTGTNATYGNWSLLTTNGATIWNAFGSQYLPSGLTSTQVNPYFNWTNMGSLTSCTFKCDTYNDDDGTMRFSYTIGYNAAYLSSFTESFIIYFYINNLYGLSGNFVFNWIDSTTTTTADATKAETIKNLKATKYANQITADDIITNFISYTIKDTSGNDLTLDSSCVSLSFSNDLSTLQVIINIPLTSMPTGFANNANHIQSYSYTGFKSIGNYSITKKDSSQLSSFLSTIYPSQLTQDDVFNNFITIGSGFANSLTVSDFTITISNVDDTKGTLTVSVAAKQDSIKSKIQDYDALPDDVKALFENIITSVGYSGFKTLDTTEAFKAIPSMIALTKDTNEYLPSEIWGQYEAYLNGTVSENDVILLKNLGFSLLANKNDLEISCLNTDTCDTDGYLSLQFKIKDNAVTTVDYAGSEFPSSNGKLLFNTSFLPSDITYPYVVKWNIETSAKYFAIVDQNNQTEINSPDSTYSFNMKENCPFWSSGSTSHIFSNQVTESDIASLIDAEGYNYKITLDCNQDKGYLVATIDLSLATPPLYEGDSTANNSNYVKTLYLYNFDVPMGSWTKETIITAIAVVIAVFVTLMIWFLVWGCKVIRYKKKAYNWNQKKKNDKLLSNFEKKNSFYKE